MSYSSRIETSHRAETIMVSSGTQCLMTRDYRDEPVFELESRVKLFPGPGRYRVVIDVEFGPGIENHKVGNPRIEAVE